MLAAAHTPASRAHSAAVTRRARLLAVALDLAILAACTAVAAVAATAWLLLRTRGGAVDVGRGDAAVALALLMAATPAWWALLASEVLSRGATPGLARVGVTVEGASRARGFRLALHPLASVAWAWLAAVAIIATVPVLPLPLASMAILTAGGGAVSAVLALRDARARGLHDLIAGTRLVRA